MSQDDNAPALLASIEAEQLRLREALAGQDESRFAARPQNGQWSVVENLRHLLFAEQLHLAPLAHGPVQWSAFGLTPNGLRERFLLRGVGTATTTNVGEVLDAWQAAHLPVRELANRDTEEVRKALQKNLQHLRTHIKVIERLLRTLQREARFGPK